ncbi:MAG: SBBP repeat-containing protein [candidate division WOR-3 bacterium]
MLNNNNSISNILINCKRNRNWAENSCSDKLMLDCKKPKMIVTAFALMLLCSVLLPSFLFSAVDTAWTRRYNGPSNDDDGAEAIAVDSAGNVYIAGYTYVSGQGFNYLTIKYSDDGVQQWLQTYNHTDNDNDRATAMVIDNSGNIYVTGISFSYNTGFDCATIKYNSSGTIQWIQRYNGFGNGADCGNAIAVDNFNNVYVVGYSDSSNNRDYLIIKYNPSGNQEWVRKYNGTANSTDVAKAIALDDSGYIYVTGRSEGIGTTADYVTIKYHPTGQVQWIQRYNGTGNNWDEPYAIAVDALSNVYVTGESMGSGTDSDILTIKYNSSGNQIWVQRYDGPDNSYDYGTAIKVDGQGNVYVTGPSRASGAYDYATIKYNSSGVQQWVQRYNGLGNSGDESYALSLDTYGNVYVTGKSYGPGTYNDYTTIKYNPNGVQEWVISYDFNSAGDYAYGIEVDGQGNVYVTGTSSGDCATIKYIQTAGIEENHSCHTNNHISLNTFPNPFLNQTIIHYSLNQKSDVSISVYDVSGTLIKNLLDSQKEPGAYSINWDGTDNHNRKIKKGIYFLILKANDYKIQTKLLMLRNE